MKTATDGIAIGKRTRAAATRITIDTDADTAKRNAITMMTSANEDTARKSATVNVLAVIPVRMRMTRRNLDCAIAS